MYRLAASCLHPTGRFVFSAHHFDLRSRYRGAPREGTYPRSGIYRRLFAVGELIGEARPYFGSVRAVKRALYLPAGLGELGRVSGALSWLAERAPVLSGLGGLLIAWAERPVAAGPASR